MVCLSLLKLSCTFVLFNLDDITCSLLAGSLDKKNMVIVFEGNFGKSK